MDEKITVQPQDIGELSEERLGNYARYTLKARAIPDARDGLKPVQRRILYGMYKEGNRYNKKYRKSAKSVGSIMGNYHPHGDSSIYEAMVRLSQDWVTGLPLIDFHGNNGSVDGDSPASFRYTEARLTREAEELYLAGITKKDVVPMVLTYDDESYEPLALPSKLPMILVNGVSGVAVGFATEIPPHNIREVLHGVIALEKNPEITLDEMMAEIPAPDYPTGGVITGAKYMRKAYETGRIATGKKPKLRAKYHIEKEENARKGKGYQYIIIDELPYGVNKAKLVLKIEETFIKTENKTQKIAGLIGIIDETSRGKLKIRITCEENADTQKILAVLFSKTELEVNINYNSVAIVKGKPETTSLLTLLRVANDFRKETRRKELEYDLAEHKNAVHLVEGFLKLSEISDEVIKTIRESKGTKAEIEKELVSQYDFSSIQAKAITSKQLYTLGRQDVAQQQKEKERYDKLIYRLEQILTKPQVFSRLIVKEYEDLLKSTELQLGERKTEVQMEEESWDVRKIDTVVTEDLYVGVSKYGYVKRSSVRSYETTEDAEMLEGDYMLCEEKATNKHFLMVFTNRLRYMYLPIHELPETRWKQTNKHISSLVTLEDGEEIVNAFVVHPTEDKELMVLTVKNDGKVKRTSVAQHEVTKRYFQVYQAIKQTADEELVDARLLQADEVGYVGFKDSKGGTMYFAVDEIVPKGLRTEGMRGIHLDEVANERISDYMYETNEETLKFNGYQKKKRGLKGTKPKK